MLKLENISNHYTTLFVGLAALIVSPTKAALAHMGCSDQVKACTSSYTEYI